MGRAHAVAAGRRAAEAGMADTCTIRRRTGENTDPATGNVVPTYLVPDPYVGKCRIQQPTATARPHEVGEDFLLMLRLEVQLPMSVTGLKVGDEITVTVSVRDPDLVGRVFLAHDLAHKSDATARRVAVVERTGS